MEVNVFVKNANDETRATQNRQNIETLQFLRFNGVDLETGLFLSRKPELCFLLKREQSDELVRSR